MKLNWDLFLRPNKQSFSWNTKMDLHKKRLILKLNTVEIKVETKTITTMLKPASLEPQSKLMSFLISTLNLLIHIKSRVWWVLILTTVNLLTRAKPATLVDLLQTPPTPVEAMILLQPPPQPPPELQASGDLFWADFWEEVMITKVNSNSSNNNQWLEWTPILTPHKLHKPQWLEWVQTLTPHKLHKPQWLEWAQALTPHKLHKPKWLEWALTLTPLKLNLQCLVPTLTPTLQWWTSTELSKLLLEPHSKFNNWSTSTLNLETHTKSKVLTLSEIA